MNTKFTENKPYLKKLKQQINLNIATYEYSAITESEWAMAWLLWMQEEPLLEAYWLTVFTL